MSSNLPSREEMISQAENSSPMISVAMMLWMMALMIIMIISIAFFTLAVIAGDYYANTKAVRDADAGGILSQLGSIAAVKDWALPLAFVGLAMFIAGFGFAFANILRNVRLRGDTMAATLPELKERFRPQAGE